MRARAFVIAVGIAGVFASGIAQAADGPYTEAQAEDGHVRFNNHCAECHGPKLNGALGPNLHDAKFQAIYADKPVSDLKNFVYQNMPMNAPKSLKDEDLYPILAWIMKNNKVPAGDKPLTKDNVDNVKFPKTEKMADSKSDDKAGKK